MYGWFFYKVFYRIYLVAHPAAVYSIIVISEYAQFLQLPSGYSRDKRHEIVWDSIWILSDKSALMGSNRIEIPQQQH